MTVHGAPGVPKMQLSNTRLGKEPFAETPPVSFASTTGTEPGAKPTRRGRATPGFGPAVGSTRTTAIGGLILLAVAGLVFISTFLADREWTSSSVTRLTVEGPRALLNDTDVLAVPALDPASWREGAAWAASSSEIPAAASPQAIAPGPRHEHTTPAADVVPISEVIQAAPQVGPQKLDPSLLVAQGDLYLARSDVVAARLLYRRAADGGSSIGASALAASFDPILLEQRGIRGGRADPAAALQWYSVAMKMGDATARARADALIQRLRSAASRGDAEARAILNPSIH